jgi:hypothetical protein
MPTNVEFYTEESNLDYLMPDVRVQFGDLTGDEFSDTILRTAMISGVRFLQRKWNGKYQVYLDSALLSPQPATVPIGYKRINSLHGEIDIPSTILIGSIFRDPYAVFTTTNPPLIESIDEQAIILAAVYILRKAQVSSNAGDFLSWGTEDIRYNNLGAERGLSKLLQQDLDALNAYLQTRIARPRRSDFPVGYIPALTELL